MNVPDALPEDYIDKLPEGATVGRVFTDLYAHGELLLDGLEGRLLAAESGLIDMPPSSLDIERATTRPLRRDESGMMDLETGPARHSRTIYLPYGQRHRFPEYLFRLTQEGLEAPVPTPSDRPVAIAAFRPSDFPTAGDYYLEQHEDRVAYSIRHVSATTPREAYEHELPYVGGSDLDCLTPVKALEDADKKRLRIVTNSIEAGLLRAKGLVRTADALATPEEA